MSTIQKLPKYNTVTLQLKYEAIKSILGNSKINLDVDKAFKQKQLFKLTFRSIQNRINRTRL